MFGVHPSASEGFDTLLDKPLPPPAPTMEDAGQQGNSSDKGIKKGGQERQAPNSRYIDKLNEWENCVEGMGDQSPGKRQETR